MMIPTQRVVLTTKKVMNNIAEKSREFSSGTSDDAFRGLKKHLTFDAQFSIFVSIWCYSTVKVLFNYVNSLPVETNYLASSL